MNAKAIYEIGDIIKVTRKWTGKKLNPIELINTTEYIKFRESYPELCRIAEYFNPITKFCISDVAFHICKKNPEDCRFVVDVIEDDSFNDEFMKNFNTPFKD